jgi:predicted MFS family arabinose efflux permease
MASSVSESLPPVALASARVEAPAAWGGVFAMTLCVFALIASEFMPVSLLTPMAADLRISEGLAGQGLAISGAFALLTSLGVTTLARRVDRKLLLLVLAAAMGLSGFIVGMAHDLATYLTGRALIGVVVGGFWSLSAAVVMRLVPAPEVPRALAVLNGGNALATTLAAPLGSYLATLAGWRGAFLALVPISLAALVWLAVSLPPMPVDRQAARSASPLRLLARRDVRVAMLALGSFFMGEFILFTYLRPFLEQVTGLDERELPLMLLLIGLAGFVGTALIGRLLQRSLRAALVGIPLLLAGLAFALATVGRQPVLVAVLLALWGLASTAAPVGWWTWMARALPRDAEAGGGLMVAMVQLCIAAGSVAGGLLFDAWGPQATFVASAGVLLAAALAAGAVRGVSAPAPAADRP